MSLSSCSQRNKWSGWISPVCISGKLCQVYYLYHLLLCFKPLIGFLVVYKTISSPFSPQAAFQGSLSSLEIFNLAPKCVSIKVRAEAGAVELSLFWTTPGPQSDGGKEKEFPLFILKTWLEVSELPQLGTGSNPAPLCLSPAFHPSTFSSCCLLLAHWGDPCPEELHSHSLSRNPGVPPGWGSELPSFLSACSCLWFLCPHLGFDLPWWHLQSLCDRVWSCPRVEQGGPGGVWLGWFSARLSVWNGAVLEPGWSTLVSSHLL